MEKGQFELAGDAMSDERLGYGVDMRGVEAGDDVLELYGTRYLAVDVGLCVCCWAMRWVRYPGMDA